MPDVEDVAEQLKPLGFERVVNIPGSTYRDNSTIIVVPTRGTGIHQKVVQSWLNLIAPMNQKRAWFFATGHEVGQAYDTVVKNILADKNLSTWKYVLTVEDDNVLPADAHVRLLESIEWGKYDAVGGLYFTKGDLNMPMAYGDAVEYVKTGVMEFRPLDTRQAIQGGQILPCLGLAMGCTLFRMDLLREIPGPWFETVADIVPDKGAQCYTQDLNFWSKAVPKGKRAAVDCRVHVGHVDPATGIVY